MKSSASTGLNSGSSGISGVSNSSSADSVTTTDSSNSTVDSKSVDGTTSDCISVVISDKSATWNVDS